MSDFIAGLCVGLAEVSIGHPFDTTKILIQNNRPWRGLSLSKYYRGWRFPLVASSVFNFTVFPVYERTLSFTQNSVLSGFLAGFTVAPIIFGFEVGKIYQQTNQKLNWCNFYQSRGIYTLYTRETIAMSAYFGMYNYCREKDYHPLISGGCAGLANWTLIYPVDVIKSRQIAQQISIKEAISIGNLWKGYSICAVRAVLVNAINFWVYETVKSHLDS